MPIAELHHTVIADTRHWLERAVIGLNLCPFAKGPHTKGQIHYAVSGAQDEAGALHDLRAELLALQAEPMQLRETTLLMFPAMFGDFYHFNDFLDDAEALLTDLGLDGELQIAPFHPQFEFADAAADAISNATNRAPYPTLHLIRETSIDRAVATHEDVEGIPARNIALLEQLGAGGWHALGVSAHVSSDAWLAAANTGPAHAADPGDGAKAANAAGAKDAQALHGKT